MKRATMLFAEAKENKMEIYNDILSAIINLELINGEAKPTRVQMLSNLAYDKLVRYLNELEGKKMITQERRTLIFRTYHHISSISMIIGAIWYVRNIKAKLIFVLDDYKSGENNQVSRKLLSSLILPSSNISHMTTTASESGRMLDVDDNVFKKVRSELMSWPGVTSQPHRFGGTEFRVNGREMGHMHGGRFADLPFPMSIRNELVKGGRALPHHVLPNSGWITFLINEESDVTALIDLFRMQYERLSNH